MIEGTPSRTAFMVAGMRAYHNLIAAEPKILSDDLAMALGGYESPEALKATFEGMTVQFAALSDPATAELFVRRIIESVCMRSRLSEGQMLDGMKRGLKQLVLLGAGLDSTAYRFKDLAQEIEIFEVDYPSTQVWKRERLAAANIDIPANVRFVTYDFENQTLQDALASGGVDMNAVTLFPWLGVQPYLTDAAVRATMQVIASFPKGSEVIMDFVSPRYDRQESINANGLEDLQTIVEGMGEPFKSRYLAEELEALLRDCGFGDVTFHMPEDLAERFLGGDRRNYSMPDGVSTLASAQV